jgi:hypothetical protein
LLASNHPANGAVTIPITSDIVHEIVQPEYQDKGII